MFELIKNFYNFFEIDFNVSVVLWLENLIKVEKICDELELCIKFINFSVEVDKWCFFILYSFVYIVDSVCYMLYSIVGL